MKTNQIQGKKINNTNKTKWNELIPHTICDKKTTNNKKNWNDEHTGAAAAAEIHDDESLDFCGL
jgi:hypothetical protein